MGCSQLSLASAVADDIQTSALKIAESRSTKGTSVPELVVSLIFYSLKLHSQAP